MCKGPGNQNIETWLDEWDRVYTEALNINLPEVKGNRPMEDFLMAVESKDPHFTSTYMMKLEDGEINDIYTLAERFRH